MELADDYPDVVIGCVGGGSNFAGPRLPVHAAQMLRDKQRRCGSSRRAALLPLDERGQYRYDFGDTTGHLTPLVKMYTSGPHFHAAGIPRRRTALSRHGPDGQPWREARADRGARRIHQNPNASRRP